MVKFTNNNAKNASTSYTLFELNYGYHPYIFYKKNISFCSNLKLVDVLLTKPQELITMYKKNLYNI